MPDQRPSTETNFLVHIDELLPMIRAHAAETERLGRIPDEIIQVLTDADVFRAAQPRQWGGLELDLACFYEGMIRIATACGSTGWVASVVGIHPWQIGLFANEAQRDVWAEDPNARASSSYAPTGTVKRVDGGFHLSGRWYFSSGVDHCTWVLLGAIVPEDGDGAEFRSFLVPRRDFTVDHDSWQVTGLRGTGSKNVVVAGAFVPDYRTHRITDVYHGTDPGFAVNDRPYYRVNWRLVFATTIATPAIGAAIGAINAFIDTNRSRVPAHGGAAVAQNPAIYAPLARALTEADAARTRIRETWTEFLSGQPIPYERRVQCLYEMAYAHSACTGAIYDLMGLNGGRTMSEDGTLQRLFRDLLAMRNHPAANLEFAAALYAQAKLGVEPAPFIRTQRYVL